MADDWVWHLKPIDPEEYRKHGHQLVDFIADYYKNIENFPVKSQVAPGYLKKLLPENAPEVAESLEEVLTDVQSKIIPGLTHWQNPKFFAYFPANSSTAGLLGEMLSSCFNIVGFSWIASPAATELETIVLDWLGKLLQLPDDFLSGGKGGGVIQGTASEAVLVVLLAARNRALIRSRTESLSDMEVLSRLTVYASDQTNDCLKKACAIAGIPCSNIVSLPTTESTNYALSPDALTEAIEQDTAAGLIPFFLCATVGTTSSTAIDPLEGIADIALEHGMWLHVDAAYAGAACICPEFRHFLNGIEKCDSFNMNAHKWFLTNFDCSALWVKNSTHLVQALSTNPSYLSNKVSDAGLVVDYKDWQIPLGRRFRSLKLWLVMRLYGASGLREYIRNHIRLAKYFETLVCADDRFEVVTPSTFGLVCFRLKPSTVRNEKNKGWDLNSLLLEAVNSSGEMFITHTVLSGILTLRMAIGSPLTRQEHIDAAWNKLQLEAAKLLC